jgi:hypothetical protein
MQYFRYSEHLRSFSCELVQVLATLLVCVACGTSSNSAVTTAEKGGASSTSVTGTTAGTGGSNVGSGGTTTNGNTGGQVPTGGTTSSISGVSFVSDPSCPSTIPQLGAVCTLPVGTQCTGPGLVSTIEMQCLCYKSSSLAVDGGILRRWWCEESYPSLCPASYLGSGTCQNAGDFTCYYVISDGSLQACNCLFGTMTCSPWGD